MSVVIRKRRRVKVTCIYDVLKCFKLISKVYIDDKHLYSREKGKDK